MTYSAPATAVMTLPIQVSSCFFYNHGNSGERLAVVKSTPLLANPTNGLPERFLDMEQAGSVAAALNAALKDPSFGLPDVFSPQTLESGKIIVVSDQLATTSDGWAKLRAHANCINDLLVRVP